MRQILLLFTLLVSSMLNGQGDMYISGDMKADIRQSFAPLDKSGVTSFHLIDHTEQFIDVGLFNGDLAVQQVPSDISIYGLVYYHMYHSYIGNSPMLPSPAAYMLSWYNYSDGAPIPIALLAQEYHQLKSDALDNNLVSYQNGQFYDVSNRSEEPYELKKVMIASITKPFSDEQSVTLVLDSDLMAGNITDNIATISVRASENAMSQNISIDQPFTLTYTSGGQHLPILKLTLQSGEVLECQMSVKLPDTEPKSFSSIPDIRVQENAPDDIEVAGATVTGYSNCGDFQNIGVLQKPFIWIEGFNPTIVAPSNNFLDPDDFDLDRGDAQTKLLNQFVNGASLWNYIDNNGYDFIYVDFDDGAADLNVNAQIVKDVIGAVNELKVGDEENVIFGESMGGVLGKQALREMELAGEDHETRELITFDSPMRGANVPMASQAAVLDLAVSNNITDRSIWIAQLLLDVIEIGSATTPWPITIKVDLKDFVPAMRSVRDVLNSPAARQLLIYNILDEDFSDHIDYYDYLESLGELEQADQIALSNGSVRQTPQHWSSNPGGGEWLLDLDNASIGEIVGGALDCDDPDCGPWDDLLSVGVDIFAGIFAIPFQTANSFDLKLRAMPNGGEPIQIFRRNVSSKAFGLIATSSSTRWFMSPENTVAIDGAPGGIQGTNINTNTLPLNATSIDPFTFCFVPTISALDIGDPRATDLFLNVENEGNIIGAGLTPALRYDGSRNSAVNTYGLFQENTFHTGFYDPVADLFVTRIRENNGLNEQTSNVLNSEYNTGVSVNIPSNPALYSQTRNYLDRDLSITSGGELNINHDGALGFGTETNNPVNDDQEFYEFAIIEDRCNGNKTTVDILNNGQFLIGDPSNPTRKGLVTMYENTEVVVHDGAFLNAVWASKLIVESGAEVRVKSGGILRISHKSNLDIKQGAKLILEDGALLQLWDGNQDGGEARVLLAGTLEIDGLINLSGNSPIVFKPFNKVIVSDNLTIQGVNSSITMLDFEHGSSWDFDAQAFNIRDGKIRIDDGSNWNILNPGLSIVEDLKFKGEGLGSIIFSDGSDFLLVQNNEFDKTNMTIDSYVLGEQLLDNARVDNCNFLESDLHLASSSAILVSNSDFDGDKNSLVTTNVDRVSIVSTDFDNCQIDAYETPILDIHGGDIKNSEEALYIWSNSNIILTDNVKIHDNDIGLNMIGDDNSGLIVADCAKFYNNTWNNIVAEDPIFAIDAVLHAMDDGVLQPNAFEFQPGYYTIAACYLQRNGDFTEIPAKANYWGPNAPVNLQSYSHFQGSGSGCLSQTDISIPMDVSFNTATFPVGCGTTIPEGWITPAPYQNGDQVCGVCPPVVDAGIANTYFQAYSNILSENYLSALSSFAPIASVSETYRSNLSPYERTMVDAARVFVDVMSDGVTFRADMREIVEHEEVPATWPNPVSDVLHIENKYIGSRYNFFNSQGSLVLTGILNDNTINTSSINNGIYLLQVVGSSSAQVFAQKIIIQK